MTEGAFRGWWRRIVAGEVAWVPALAVGMGVTVVALLLEPDPMAMDVVAGLLGVTTFLLGVLLAFVIDRMRNRLNHISELLKRSDAHLLSLDHLAAVFGEQAHVKIRSLIDAHLLDQVDYRLVDFHRSADSYFALVAAVRNVSPTSDRESTAYGQALGLAVDLGTNRALIEAAVGQRLASIEWWGLGALLAIQVTLLVVLTASSLGSIVSGTFSAILITLLLLVRRLDLLRWQEAEWVWKPLERLFRSLDLVPYFPEQVIESGRYTPRGTVRIATYPDPYPEMSTKTIRLEELR